MLTADRWQPFNFCPKTAPGTSSERGFQERSFFSDQLQGTWQTRPAIRILSHHDICFSSLTYFVSGVLGGFEEPSGCPILLITCSLQFRYQICLPECKSNLLVLDQNLGTVQSIRCRCKYSLLWASEDVMYDSCPTYLIRQAFSRVKLHVAV